MDQQVHLILQLLCNFTEYATFFIASIVKNSRHMAVSEKCHPTL